MNIKPVCAALLLRIKRMFGSELKAELYKEINCRQREEKKKKKKPQADHSLMYENLNGNIKFNLEQC